MLLRYLTIIRNLFTFLALGALIGALWAMHFSDNILYASYSPAFFMILALGAFALRVLEVLYLHFGKLPKSKSVVIDGLLLVYIAVFVWFWSMGQLGVFWELIVGSEGVL